MEKTKLVLLGDSVIDNKAYVARDEPDVSQQIDRLAPALSVEQRASDGATSEAVLSLQLAEPVRASDLVVLSAGGNDALNQLHRIEDDRARPAIELLTEFWGLRERFRGDYARLLDRIAASLGAARQSALILTIYNPRFDLDFSGSFGGEAMQQAAEAALSFFNDVIQAEARARGFAILDLRRICTESADFANPIEPSAVGGEKIAGAITQWATALASATAD